MVPRLALDFIGEGEPVLFIHGLGGTSNTFRPQMKALSAQFRCLGFDLPGAGRSPLQELTTITTLVAASIMVLDDAGIARARVVAHSMGGLVAMHLATMFSDRVSQLVLLGPVRGPTPASETALRARAELARSSGMTPVADQLIEVALSDETKARQPVVIAMLRELLMRQDAAGYAAHCEALAGARPATPEAIKAPTLILTGDSDRTAPPAVCAALAKEIPGAEFLVLPGCGHWATLEAAPQVISAISKFFMTGQAPART